MSEKRLMVELRSVQQVYEPKNVRWIPTHLMHSDGLTKVDDALMCALLLWCQSPWVQLVETSKVPKNKDQCESEAV